MADQLDRDFELISYNTHPFQMFAYEVRNNQIAYETEKFKEEEKRHQTKEEEMLEYIE